MRLIPRLFFSLVFLGPAIYFALDGDVVTAAVCLAAGLAAFGGYRTGAAYIVAIVIAATAAIAYAPTIGLAQEWRFSQWLGTTGLTNRLLSVGLVGLLITMLIVLIVSLVISRFFARRPELDSLNRWLGFGLGAVEGVVAMLFFLGGMLVIEPIELQQREFRDADDVRGQAVSRFILLTSASTRDSRIGPAIVAYNPFTRIPSLNKVEEIQESVRVLSEPSQIQRLLEDPSIKQLQQRPEIRRVMSELQSDPDLQDILTSGNPMNRQTALTLMNHPAVLELLDQPGFLEEAAKVIRDDYRTSVSPRLTRIRASERLGYGNIRGSATVTFEARLR